MTERRWAWFLPMAAVALALGILLGRQSIWLWPGLTALAFALVAAVLLDGQGRVAAAVAAMAALGFALGQTAYHPALPVEGDYAVTGTVAQELRQEANGQVKTVLHHVTLNGQAADDAYWSFYLREGESLPEGLKPGRQVTLTARLYHPSGADNPGGYDFREYLLQQGITIGLYGWEGLMVDDAPLTADGLAAAYRHRLSEGLVSVMGEEAGGYASAMLLGVRSLVPAEDREAFSRLGIAHVLSISGFHVGVLAAMVAWVMAGLRLSRRLRLAVMAVLMSAYALLTGLHPPVLRAAALLLLRELGAVRLRQRSGVHLLSAAWIVMLLLAPCQLTGASFQLTYGAVLGLMLVTPRLTRMLPGLTGAAKGIWAAVCTSLGAQIGLLLPQLYWFGELPLLGLALNVAVFALVSAVMALYWLTLAVMALPGLSTVLGWLAARVTAWLLGGVRWMAEMDVAVLWTKQAGVLTALGWLMLMGALMIFSPLRGRKQLTAGVVGVALMAVSLFPWPNHTTTYTQLSVGSADAAVLLDEDRVVVIDTGEDGRALAQYLHQRRLSVDALILTHLHSDHAGGIQALLDERIPVKTCYLADGATNALIDPAMAERVTALADSGTSVITLGRGDVIDLPSGEITVLWPERGYTRPNRDANLSSLALRLEARGIVMLLTGDLDGLYEHYAAVPANVLKVAHHGSSASTSDEFLKAVDAEALVLSTGDEGRAQRLSERAEGLPIYDTAHQGAVTIRIKDGGYTVTTTR